MNEDWNIQGRRKTSLWALSPLFVFLCLYLVTSLIVNDFYKTNQNLITIYMVSLLHLLILQEM